MGIAQALGRPLVRLCDLAEKENLPLKFLEQIFLQLKEAGYIESRRGKQGGYLLALPAAEIPVGDIVRLLDGTLLPLPCINRMDGGPCSCPDETYCSVHFLMSEVHQAVADIMDRMTLGDMVKKTLRKIRRNKAAVPFVKMVMKRDAKKGSTPKRARRKVAPARARTLKRSKKAASSRKRTASS